MLSPLSRPISCRGGEPVKATKSKRLIKGWNRYTPYEMLPTDRSEKCRKGAVQRKVVYNAETKFTIQNKPDGSVDDVIVGRRVICLGKFNDKAQLLATRVEVRSR